MGAWSQGFARWENRELQTSGQWRANALPGASESPAGVAAHGGCKPLTEVTQCPSQECQWLMCRASCLSPAPREEQDPEEPPLAGVHLQ